MGSGTSKHLLMRWVFAAVASTCIVAAYATYLNRHGCWLYMREAGGVVTLLALAWVWLLLMLGFRLKGRIALGICTLAVAIAIPHVDSLGPAGMKELYAIGQLRRFAETLNTYKVEHPQLGYPENLPNIEQADSQRKFYVFDYIRAKSSSDPQTGFELRATPTTRSRNCGCVRSFTITSEGHLYYTMEDRPASPSDVILQ